MHVLLTGSSGRVGSATLIYLLNKSYQVTALDIVPLPPIVSSQIPEAQLPNLRAIVCDLTDYLALEAVFTTSPTPIEWIIHLSAIPDPLALDGRTVHNNNVTSSYNVMRTGADHGVRRMVQASSRFDELPITEETPIRPEDPYALSKAVCELQASALTRFYPGLRIASLRFHMVKEDYASSVPASRWEDLYCWVSYSASALACELGLTSEGWEGHTVFNVVAPDICYEGGVQPEEQSRVEIEKKKGSLELLEGPWKGRYDEKGLNRDWWEGRPRRAFWDSTKAEKLLGWRHDV